MGAMNPRYVTLLRHCIGLGACLTFIPVVVTPADAKPQDKVTICHATSAVNDPYNQTTVSANSIVNPGGEPSGHGTHTGPIYPTPGWGDIIPPFDYNNDQGGSSHYPGLGWGSDGQAIWDAGCLIVFEPIMPPEETTTTTLPPSTTSSRPGSTTSSHPGASTTTRPGASTTTTEPEPPIGTTPTTAPPSELPPPPTDPPDGVEVMPPEEAVVIGPQSKVVHLGSLTVPQRADLEAALDPPPPIAQTGADVFWIVLAALGLILAGSLFVVGSRRPQDKSPET
jgi:hypothetical protein